MVLANSPGKSDAFGAGLKKPAAPPAADEVGGKENNGLPATGKWREEAKKPWKSASLTTKTTLDLGAKPTEFKANAKGAMMVFSPTPMNKPVVEEAPRPRVGQVLQFSPGNGKKKAPPVLSSGASMATPVKHPASTVYETCPTPYSALRESTRPHSARKAAATPETVQKKSAEEQGAEEAATEEAPADVSVSQETPTKKASRAPLAGVPPWAVKDKPSPERALVKASTSASAAASPLKQSTTPTTLRGASGGGGGGGPVPKELMSPLSPQVHNIWLSAVGMWQNGASGDASLSLDEDDEGLLGAMDHDTSLLSPGAMEGMPDEELTELACTPAKFKRYLAIHLQKLLEQEEARSQLTEELTQSQAELIDSRAETLRFKEAFEAKEKEAQENEMGIGIYQEQVEALEVLVATSKVEIEESRAELKERDQTGARMKQELQDLTEQQWELTARAERAEEANAAAGGGSGGEVSTVVVNDAEMAAKQAEALQLAVTEARREAELSYVASKALASDECAALKAQVAHLKADLEQAVAQADKHSGAGAALQATAEENASLQKELKELNQELLRHNEEVKADLESATASNAKLELDLEESAAEKISLAQQLEVATAAAEKAMEEVVEVKSYQKQINHTANARSEEAQLELAAAQQEAQESRAKVETLEQAVAQAAAEMDEKVQALELESGARMAELEEAKANSEQLLEEVATLKRQGQQTGEETNAEVALLQEQVTALKHEKDQASEESKAEVAQLAAEVDVLQTELASAEVKAEEELAAAHAKAEAALGDAEAARSEKESEVASIQVEVEVLSAKLATVEAQAEEAAQASQVKEEALASETSVVTAQAEAAQAASQAEIAQLKEDLLFVEQQGNEICAEANEEVKGLNAQLEALGERLAAEKAKAAASEVAHEEEVATLKRQGQQTGEEANAEVAVLQEQVTALKHEKDQVKEVSNAEVAQLAAEVDVLQTELASAEVKAEEELAAAHAKAEEALVEMEELKNLELAATKEELHSLVAIHEAAVESAESSMASLKVQHENDLSEKAASAKAAYDALAAAKADEIESIVATSKNSSTASAKGMAEAHSAALREQQELHAEEAKRMAAEFEAKELAAAEDFKSQLEAKETKLTVHASEAAAAAEAALEATTKELGAQVEAAHAQGQSALEVVKEECEALTDQLAESEVRLEEVEEASAARTAELEADLATLQETALSNAEGAAVMVLDLKAQLESERTEAKELGDASAEVVKQLEADLEASTAKAEEEASTAASRIGQLETELEGAVASANQTEAEGAEKVVALQEELASHKEQAASNQSEAAQTIAGLEGELSEARTLAEAASEESSGRISQLEAELEAQGQGAATAAEVHAREVGVLAAELSEVQAAAEENSLQASAQLRTVVSELEVTKAAAMEAAEVAADKHTGALATAAEDLQAAVAVHVSEVGLLNGELESTRSEVAKLVEESAELQREKSALETESEERAELLIKYAAQVAEIVAAGEARVRDFENTIEGLNTGMAMAGEAAAETIAQKVAEMEEIKRQLFEAEEGRLQALARIEKAEMKADLSDAEADAQAKAAQVANTAKDVAQQKLDAALAHIQKIEAAKDAAEESEADAHAAAAQWKEEVDALQALRRKMHNEIVDLKGNIRVFCRIRPSKRELQGLPAPTNEASSLVVNPHPTNASGEVIDVFDGAPVGTDSGLRRYGDGKRHSFGFDKVFDGASTQDEVYAEVSPLVQSALDGYSLCIFAYGQTGSGKTHTMIGDTEVGDVAIVPAVADAEGAAAAVAAATAATEQAGLDRGIVYRACEQLFTDLNTPTSSGTWESTVTIEAVEIYNEKLRDLLPSKAAKAAATASGGGGGGGRTAGAVPPGAGLEIRKEPKTGRVYIEGIEAHPVTSCTGAVGFLDRALRQRATKATKCNDQSSRSHCVLIVRFAKTNVETGEVKAGALHFCDLAGSERLAKSGSGDDPALLREAQAINKSLSALGNTMSALVVGGRHVPFRDSRLTFLLQECFTGDGKSLLVCALSPEGDSVTESIGSLRFAQTVSQVTAATRQRCANCGEKTCSKGAKGDKKGAAEDEPNSGGSDKPPTKKRVR